LIVDLKKENINLKEKNKELEEKNAKTQDDMLYWFKKYEEFKNLNNLQNEGNS
jgi:hypothetical protein